MMESNEQDFSRQRLTFMPDTRRSLEKCGDSKVSYKAWKTHGMSRPNIVCVRCWDCGIVEAVSIQHQTSKSTNRTMAASQAHLIHTKKITSDMSRAVGKIQLYVISSYLLYISLSLALLSEASTRSQQHGIALSVRSGVRYRFLNLP